MTETPAVDPHKRLALELANNVGDTKEPATVVARAKVYHEFLTGKPDTSAATAKVTGAPATTAAKPKAAPAAGTQTPPTTKPGAAAPKTGAAGATTAAKTTAAVNTAKATAAAKTAAPGAEKPAPKGDTKDPKGNNTYDDVVAALQKVMRSVPGDNDKRDKGRKLAYDLLAANGGGVKGVRDLKPALYDAVVTACEAAGKPKAKAAAAPAPAPETDDLGGEPEADDLGGDPPEETGGGLPAEEGQGTPDGEDA